AVLAAAAVDAAVDDLRVPARLAGDAGPHAGNRLAAPFGDVLAAFLAMDRALSARQPRARREHRVLHGIVDLVLNRAVARPSAGHFRFHLSSPVSSSEIGSRAARAKPPAVLGASRHVTAG